MTYELNGKRDNLQMNKRKAEGRRTEGEGGGGQRKRLMPVMFASYGRIGFSLGMLKRKRGQFGVVCF